MRRIINSWKKNKGLSKEAANLKTGFGSMFFTKQSGKNRSPNYALRFVFS